MVEKKNITVVLVGTLDTKGPEIGCIRDVVLSRGCRAIVIDAGILGKPRVEADITREQVAESGGISFEELLLKAKKSSDRMQFIQVMIEGVKKEVGNLYDQGGVDGIISVGGSMGMAIGVNAMKTLPVGIPKLMVGTHFYPQYLGESDLTIMHSHPGGGSHMRDGIGKRASGKNPASCSHDRFGRHHSGSLGDSEDAGGKGI
jgi:uncharacterized protein (UPF0261 family)